MVSMKTKKTVVTFALFFSLFAPFKTVYSYVLSPIDCAAEHGSELLKVTTNMVVCIYNNVTLRKD